MYIRIKDILLIVLLAISTSLAFGQEKINLAGEWQVKLDPQNKGMEEQWFTESSFKDMLTLPGCIQEQGYGEVPGPNTIWWDGKTLEGWFTSRPWINPKYNTAENFKTQAFLVPDRYYIGAAWFKKEIEIPKDWENENAMLFLERCHWETQLWINGKFIGSNRSLGTPHEYLLGNLPDGKNTIVLRVDNSSKVDLGSRAHATSDQTAGTWNGIVGKLELRKQTPIHIKRVRAFPNISEKLVSIEVQITGLQELKKATWEIEVNVKGYNGNKHTLEPKIFSGKIDTDSSMLVKLTYPLGEEMQLWDEFDPNLYELTLNMKVKQKRNEFTDNYTQSFGVKEFKIDGSQFTINGIKTFLRGNADCAVMPKTGYAPMDVASWKKVWKTYKDFGLNMARFHSWCPPRAAFIAADEVGIYLAPEVMEWASVTTQDQLDFFLEESKKILETYGNHASFIQMGLGNEKGGKAEIFKELLDRWKAWDSRHLYTIKANANYEGKGFANEGADFEVLRKSGKEPTVPARYQAGWPPKPQNSAFINRAPQTVINWQEAVMREKRPIIQHETAQICAFPNIEAELPKYTGYLKATYLEIAKEQMKERGLYNQLPDFVEASGKWQVELTREEMEAAYRTPGLAGFHWLGLADFTGQHTAPVGFTDAFYDAKSYVNTAKVRQWNGPTVLLAAMPKRILTSINDFKADVLISHFGKEKLNLQVTAELKNQEGEVFQSWRLPQKEITQGSGQKLGEVSASNLRITKASRLILELKSADNQFVNQYDLWVFPEVKKAENPHKIIVSGVWDENIEAYLEQGKTVLLLPKQNDLKDQLPICFTNHYWTSFGKNEGQSSATGVLFDTSHPIFKDFPTEKHVNWQWWDVLTYAHPMVLDSYDSNLSWPKDYKSPIQPIDSWKINRKLALLTEAKVGKGNLIICSIDIETDLENRPVTKLLRNNLLKYISSDSFNPKVTVGVKTIQEIFSIEKQSEN
ncbi:sugar-binding domain-containing protein [Seonamhaeicola aphaedonensis]|uniref:beta-galactosidase n=1 Tax=Seonamhaeicola aphaedonensis TaxID=1461338 RepID=A0A3D9HEA9_9FLAO|nr:sugar-binding domain-containing protein [Seonamhaeicola aphaedonensis]RED47818.1 glycosyl hydrolase family 2 [Seonamhaeicola aphaedonensis]